MPNNKDDFFGHIGLTLIITAVFVFIFGFLSRWWGGS